jgi:hypothetical protein
MRCSTVTDRTDGYAGLREDSVVGARLREGATGFCSGADRWPTLSVVSDGMDPALGLAWELRLQLDQRLRNHMNTVN